MTFLEHASKLGISVVASRSVDAAAEQRITRSAQAMKTCQMEGMEGAGKGVPSYVSQALNAVRSTPGVSLALVGMKRQEHVRDNLDLLKYAKLDVNKVECLLEEGARLAAASENAAAATKALEPRKYKLSRGSRPSGGRGGTGSASDALDTVTHDGEDKGAVPGKNGNEKADGVPHKESYSDYLKKALGNTFRCVCVCVFFFFPHYSCTQVHTNRPSLSVSHSFLLFLSNAQTPHVHV